MGILSEFKIYYGYDPTINNGNGGYISPYIFELDSINGDLSTTPDQVLGETIAETRKLNIPKLSSELRIGPLSYLRPRPPLHKYPIYLNPKQKLPTTITVNYEDSNFSDLFSYFTNLIKIKVNESEYNFPENYSILYFFDHPDPQIQNSLENCFITGVFDQYMLIDDYEQLVNILDGVNLWKEGSTIADTKEYTIDARWSIDYTIKINGKAHYKSARLDDKNFTITPNVKNDQLYGPIDYEVEDKGSVTTSSKYKVTRSFENTFIPGEYKWYNKTATVTTPDPNSYTTVTTTDEHNLVDGVKIKAYISQVYLTHEQIEKKILSVHDLSFYYVKVIDAHNFQLYLDRKLTKHAVFAYPNIPDRRINYKIDYRNIFERGWYKDYYHRIILAKALKGKTTIVSQDSNTYINNSLKTYLQGRIYQDSIQDAVYYFINNGPIGYFYNKKGRVETYLTPENQEDMLKRGEPDGPVFQGRIYFRDDLRDIGTNVIRDDSCINGNEFEYRTHTIDDDGISITIGDVYLSKILVTTNDGKSIQFIFKEPQPNNNSFWRLKNG